MGTRQECCTVYSTKYSTLRCEKGELDLDVMISENNHNGDLQLLVVCRDAGDPIRDEELLSALRGRVRLKCIGRHKKLISLVASEPLDLPISESISEQ